MTGATQADLQVELASIKRDLHYIIKMNEDGFKNVNRRLDLANGRLDKHEKQIIMLEKDYSATNKEVHEIFERFNKNKKDTKEKEEKQGDRSFEIKMLLVGSLVGIGASIATAIVLKLIGG